MSTIDPRLEDIVNRLIDQCMDHKALGVVKRLDVFQETYEVLSSSI